MIWQRQLLTYGDSLGMIKHALKTGYLLISEFDDDPSHWPTIEANKNLNFTPCIRYDKHTTIGGTDW